MLDRLSVLDASFLARERTATPLHTGGVGIFGPGLDFERVLVTLQVRLPRVPLGRKRVLNLGRGRRPVWVDDDDFDLSYHLRHAALPPPGDVGQLGEFLARLLARPLDRARPLWEVYLIEGLGGGRSALFRKLHVAMSGGERGDPFAVLLDESPGPAEDAGELPRWEPPPPPGPLQLTAGTLRDEAERLAVIGREIGRLVTTPSRLVRGAAATAANAVGLVGRIAGTAPRSPLNRRLSLHRRVAMARTDLDDLRGVRRAFGGSINDVVVTVAGDAVGRLLRWRGHDTTDLDLRVMVPVRVHGEPEGEGTADLGGVRTVGDGVVGVLVPLPVMRMDPVARLYRVRGEMAGLTESRQAVAADNLVRLAGYAPPNLHSIAARLVSAEQRYNLAISNAPGPQSPRYLAGVRMEESYPFLPLVGDCALSIAVSSYAGAMFWGLTGERDAMTDLHLLGDFILEAIADLRRAAERA